VEADAVEVDVMEDVDADAEGAVEADVVDVTVGVEV